MIEPSKFPTPAHAGTDGASKNYRCYFIDTNDHIQSFEQVECETDAQAALQAEVLLASSPLTTAELWCGTRLVGRWSKAEAAKVEHRVNAGSRT